LKTKMAPVTAARLRRAPCSRPGRSPS
jgi:hypothetical protein